MAWTQTLLMPPPIVEVRLRLGLIPTDNHLRWMIEVVDPGSSELLALYSRPGARLSDWSEEVRDAMHLIERAMGAVLDPDPF